jgi:hypothetical protein
VWTSSTLNRQHYTTQWGKKLFPFENACTAFPSTLVSMLELSPPLPILILLRVGGLSLLNIRAVQAGSSPVRVSDEADFFNLPNPSSRTMALESTQPLTEMSTRNFPGGKKRAARRADNLTAVCEPNVCKLWEPQPLTTLRASTACTGIALPYTFKKWLSGERRETRQHCTKALYGWHS